MTPFWGKALGAAAVVGLAAWEVLNSPATVAILLIILVHRVGELHRLIATQGERGKIPKEMPLDSGWLRLKEGLDRISAGKK